MYKMKLLGKGKKMLFALKLVAGILAALGTTGVVYHEIETRRDLIKYPPLGSLVDVGTHKLHIISSGEKTAKNQPAVVLDAGLGCSSIDWMLVQPEIAKFAHVCSYDRAGYGWSEESSTPRTSENIVKELHTLLHNAQIPAPYILVGHSSGGTNVQLYASTYPDEVAGIVLVDSSHENQLQEMPEKMLKLMANIEKEAWIAKSFLAPVGFLRLMQQCLFVAKIKEAAAQQKYPEAFLDMRIANMCTTKFMRTAYEENKNFTKSLEQIKQTSRSFGATPLTVIAAGNFEELEAGGCDEETIGLMMEMRKKHMHDLSTRSTKGKLVIAQKSGHMIPLDQPEIIVQSVREIILETKK